MLCRDQCGIAASCLRSIYIDTEHAEAACSPPSVSFFHLPLNRSQRQAVCLLSNMVAEHAVHGGRAYWLSMSSLLEQGSSPKSSIAIEMKQDVSRRAAVWWRNPEVGCITRAANSSSIRRRRKDTRVHHTTKLLLLLIILCSLPNWALFCAFYRVFFWLYVAQSRHSVCKLQLVKKEPQLV